MIIITLIATFYWAPNLPTGTVLIFLPILSDSILTESKEEKTFNIPISKVIIRQKSWNSHRRIHWSKINALFSHFTTLPPQTNDIHLFIEYLIKHSPYARYRVLSHIQYISILTHSKVTVYLLKLQGIIFVTETISNRLKLCYPAT